MSERWAAIENTLERKPVTVARAIIQTLDEFSTLDDVVDVCNALNLYMDCKEESREIVE